MLKPPIHLCISKELSATILYTWVSVITAKAFGLQERGVSEDGREVGMEGGERRMKKRKKKMRKRKRYDEEVRGEID